MNQMPRVNSGSGTLDASATGLPTRLITYAWGERYVEELLSLALPAVLAPGNLPYLASQVKCEVVLLTEERFFSKVANAPVVAQIRRNCPLRLIGIDDFLAAPDDKYGMALTYVLHRGFSELGPAMTDSWQIFLNADFILADGSLKTLFAHLLRGERIVASPSYCVVASEVTPLLRQRIDPETCALSIPPREMAALVLRHRHNTIRGKTVNQEDFSIYYMEQFYWEVDNKTLLGHQMPVAIVGMRPERYVAEPNSFWDHGLMREFCPDAEVCVIGDSDEFLMLELRDKDVAQEQIVAGWPSARGLGERMILWVTPYQRYFARRPLTLHADDLPVEVREARAKLRAFVDEVLSYVPVELPSHIDHPQWNYHWPGFMEARHKYLSMRLGPLTEMPAPHSLFEIDRCWWKLDAARKEYARRRHEIAQRLLRGSLAGNAMPASAGVEVFPSVVFEQSNETDLLSSSAPGVSSVKEPAAWTEGGRNHHSAVSTGPQYLEEIRLLDLEFELTLNQLNTEYEPLLRKHVRASETPFVIIRPDEAEGGLFALMVHSWRSLFRARPRRSDVVVAFKKLLLALMTRTYQKIYGKWPRVSMLSPYWAPLRHLLRALDEALARGGKGVLVVGNHSGVGAVLGFLPGPHVGVSPAGVRAGNLAGALDRLAKFDLCICDLPLAELLRFSEIYQAVRPYMRPGGTIVGLHLNPDATPQPLDPASLIASMSGLPEARVSYAGSIGSAKVLREYRSIFGLNRRLGGALIMRLVLRLPLLTLRASRANRLESSSPQADPPIPPPYCTSITAEIAVPRWFEGDDGTLTFARFSGLYLDGVDAPVFADRVVAPVIARQPGTAVILTLGQSNAANLGETRHAAKAAVNVFNIFDSKYYRAIDPLPGASNDGGSVWSRLGDMLVDAGRFRSVLFIPIAYGGSYVSEWAPGGAHHRRLQFAIHRLEAAGLAPDMLCWQQGEAEANHTMMSASEYRGHFMAMLKSLRDAGIAAPIYVATATVCENEEHAYRNSDSIRQAQQQLISVAGDILPGPDIDRIGTAHRWDGCHLSASGLDLAAQAWFEAMSAHPIALRRSGPSSA